MIKVKVADQTFEFRDREAAQRGRTRWLSIAEEWEQDSAEWTWAHRVAFNIGLELQRTRPEAQG